MTPAELVPIPNGVCPGCGAPLERSTVGEPPLFRHGGYGAERRTVTDRCPACRWQITRTVGEVRP